jgi:hypothetical protein
VSWVALLDDRFRLALELAKAGTQPSDIAADVRDVPELRAQYGDALDGLPADARLRLALEWFGDGRHPQPPQEKRTPLYTFGYTREFGLLHRLDEAGAASSLEPTWNDPPTLASRVRERPTPHDRATLHLVLTTYRDEGTEAARRAAGWSSNKDVVRAEKIRRLGLFVIDADVLWVDPHRVMTHGDQVALRVLNESWSRWLDPYAMRVSTSTR